MKRSIAVLALMLSLLGTAIYVHSVFAARSTGHTWQSSEAPLIQLGVRDKYRESGSYAAEFVVISAKGEKLRVTKKVDADQFAYVVFPQDFGGYADAGKYTWKCLVDGKPVVSGKFELGYSSLRIATR